MNHFGFYTIWVEILFLYGVKIAMVVGHAKKKNRLIWCQTSVLVRLYVS